MSHPSQNPGPHDPRAQAAAGQQHAGYGGQPIDPNTGNPVPPPGWHPGSYAQGGYMPQPAPPKKKRRGLKILLGLVAVFFLVAMCSVATGGGSGSPSSSSPGAASDPGDAQEEPSVGLNQAITSGDLEFTVHEHECGIDRVGNGSFGSDAQGQFCRVSVSIKNVGDEGVYFTSGDAKLTNAAGQEFEASTEAAMYDADSESIFEQINPGNSLSSSLYFDVPADMTPIAIELRGGFIADPAVVSLV
jgi:hypothetical protein